MPTDAEAVSDSPLVEQWESLLEQLESQGVTALEAESLLSAFPSDDSDCFGLAWTLVHILEASEGWPPALALSKASGPWAEILRNRLR
jgi:hypothetical protein